MLTTKFLVFYFISLHIVTAEYSIKNWLYNESDRIFVSGIPDLIPLRDCGVVQTLERIVGGRPTDILEYPWMALLEIKKSKNGTFKLYNIYQ